MREVGDSFFEDSLELNAEELYWTPDMFAEFTQAARLRHDQVPAADVRAERVSDYWVPQDEPVPDFELPDGEGARYRHDYYETITDLYIDDHMVLVGEWARAVRHAVPHAGRVRQQLRGDPLRARGRRGGGPRRRRVAERRRHPVPDRARTVLPDAAYADPDDPRGASRWTTTGRSSAARTRAAARRSAPSSARGSAGTSHTFLRQYKRMMDKEWAMGVTRPLLHGYTHSPADAPWPGRSHFIGLVGEAVNHRTWPEWRCCARCRTTGRAARWCCSRARRAPTSRCCATAS